MPGALVHLTQQLERKTPAALTALTVLVGITVVAAPMLARHDIISDLLITATVIVAIAFVGTSPRLLIAAVVLGVFNVIDTWISSTTHTHSGAGIVLHVVGDLLLLLVIIRVISLVYRRSEPTPLRLTAAVGGYLMAIVLFANLHLGVLNHDPNAIHRPDMDAPLSWSDIAYFSAVTQTTLGYGDMTPVAPASKSLAMAQSILGVLYVAITIAGLIGSDHRPET